MPSVSLLRHPHPHPHPQPQPHPHHHHTNLAKYPSPSPLPPHLVPAHPHPSHPVSSDPDYIVMDARDPRMSESLPSTSPISSYVPQDDIFSMSLAPSRSLIQAPLRPRSSPLIAPSSSSITDQLQHLSIKHEDDSWNQHQHDSINTQTFPWDQTCSQLTTQQPWIDTCDTTWDESTTSNTPTYSDRITPSTTLPSSASPSTSQSTWPHDQPSLSPSPTSASDEDHLLDDVAFGTPPHPSSSPDDNDELISATHIQRTIPHKHKRTSLPPLHINVHATARSPSPSPSPPPHAQHPHAHPHPIQPRPVLMIPQGMMLGLRMDEHAFARPMESPTHTRSSSLPNSTLFNRKTRSSPITITQTANTSPVTTSRRITTEIQPPARPSSRTTTYHRTGRAVSDITMTRDEATIGAPPSTPHTTPIANSRTITSRHPSAEALLMAMPTPPQTTTSTTPVMNDHCPAPLHRGSSILRSPPVFHPSSRCPPQDSPRRPHDSPLGGRRISGLRHASNADDVSPRPLPPIPIPSPPRPRRSPRRKLDGGVFEMEL